jgi:RimJ/RimL family protein N-acetyltransferase
MATQRLTLREFTEDDVDNLLDVNSDPEVMRYLTGRPTRAQIRGIHRTGHRPGIRAHHDSQHRIPARAGEVRTNPGAHRPA